MKKLLLFLIVLIFYNLSFSQQRWNLDRRMLPKPPLQKYVQLPGSKWVNHNTSSKIIQNGSSFIVVGPNVRVLPNNDQQDETIIKKNPANPNIMFGSANTTINPSGDYGEACYVTIDGGNSWSGTDAIPPFDGGPSDPGPTIDKNGVFILTALNSSNTNTAAAYSTNNGATWSSLVYLTTLLSDKNFAGTDDAPASQYYGRSYCAWSNFSVNYPPIVISYTSNSGISWSAPATINNPPSGYYSQGCDIACGPNGEVYVCWAVPDNNTFIEKYGGFAKSTNGGVSWNVTEEAFQMNGIRAQNFNGWNFRVNSFPRIAVDRSGGTRNGWIYIVVSQVNLAPAGSDCDVVLHYSSDGGSSWSAGIRVNQDAFNDGKVQFFPAIAVDEQGGINICYYDNRNYPSYDDSCQTYMSRSTDGGASWTDMLVSDHSWLVDGESGLQPYGGDYIGITAPGNGTAWPLWMDNKSGTMQAWTAKVTLFPIGIRQIQSGIPDKFALGQNYPNPFNPTTKIDFQIPVSSQVKLTVYDILGRQVELLVNNNLKAGSYSADFNASNLASGIYFYTISVGNPSTGSGQGFTQTKKMILTK